MIARMQKISTVIVLSCLLVALLAGCGASRKSGSETPEPGSTDSAGEAQTGALFEAVEGTQGDDTVQAEAFPGDRKPYDLLAQQWKDAAEPVNVSRWWGPTDYCENPFAGFENKRYNYHGYSAVDGSDYYFVAGYYDPLEQEHTDRYYLCHIDGETLEADSIELAAAILSGEDAAVCGLDAAGGELMLFVRQRDPDTEDLLHFYAVPMTPDGAAGGEVDLLPAVMQSGIRLNPDIYSNYQSAKWDGRGYFYLIDEERTDVAVMDGEGELLDVLKPFAQGQQLDSICKTPEGVRIWEAEDQGENTTFYFYFDGEGVRTLGQGPSDISSARCVNPYGEIIYPTRDKLLRRNAATGACEKLFLGSASSFQDCDACLQTSTGKVLVVSRMGAKISYYSYTSAGAAEKVTLTLACLNEPDYYVKTFVSDFSRKHPGLNISLQQVKGEDLEDRWNNLATAFVSGKAPDMVLTDREHMLILQEKGLLADLTGVIPPEVESQVFKGIMDNGRTDGKLYSISYSGGISTLIASKKLCPNGTWTIEEVLDLIEEREKAGEPITSFTNEAFSDETPSIMLRKLTMDLADSSFLDLENGKCYFDTDGFRRLLEICKKYGTPESEAKQGGNTIDSRLKDEQRAFVKDGYALAYSDIGMPGLASFSEAMAALGEDYIPVGYPTSASSGSFLFCSSGVAVSSTAEHRELIDEFLRYLLGEECQKEVMFMVRRDLIEGNIDLNGTNLDGEACAWLWRGNVTEILALKPDGSTYLEEYFALLDGSRPNPVEDDMILSIVFEEVDAYFNGGKRVEDVMNIIQNRAQLYLNERN